VTLLEFESESLARIVGLICNFVLRNGYWIFCRELVYDWAFLQIRIMEDRVLWNASRPGLVRIRGARLQAMWHFEVVLLDFLGSLLLWGNSCKGGKLIGKDLITYFCYNYAFDWCKLIGSSCKWVMLFIFSISVLKDDMYSITVYYDEAEPPFFR
jgi:hypothetical protein